METRDRKFLDLTLKLALKGDGKVSPNPLVGALIVKNNRIISTGFHEKFGGPHAEIRALRAGRSQCKGATLYVSLEPCNHYGKTPPCTDAVIAAGIKRVVIGMKDPNPLNNGKGIRALVRAGIKVSVLKDNREFLELNKKFIKYITRKMPYVVVKAAQTLDGKIASCRGDSKWITGVDSRAYVQDLRAQADAIMIGVNTLLADDPLLSCRKGAKIRTDKPVKVIVDTEFKTIPEARIFSSESPAPVIIATAKISDLEKIKKLRIKGAEILICPKNDEGKIDLSFLMKELAARDISGVLVEGGGELIASCFEEKLADRACFFIAMKIIGGRGAKTSVEGKGIKKIAQAVEIRNASVRRFKNDILVEGDVEYHSR